jgi:hypothetical protein
MSDTTYGITAAEREMFPDADPEQPFFPEAEVELGYQDGSTPAIVARMRRALRRAGATEEHLALFQREALSGTYDNVIATCMRWADVS